VGSKENSSSACGALSVTSGVEVASGDGIPLSPSLRAGGGGGARDDGGFSIVCDCGGPGLLSRPGPTVLALFVLVLLVDLFLL